MTAYARLSLYFFVLAVFMKIKDHSYGSGTLHRTRVRVTSVALCMLLFALYLCANLLYLQVLVFYY